MQTADIIIYIALLIGAVLSFISQKLTLAGAITGAIAGLLVYKGAGYTGIIMLALFFIAGSWATGWKRDKKAAGHKNGRTAGQVLANSGVAALLGTLACFMPAWQQIISILIAGSFAAATADTLSSELGTVYGTRFVNILTLKTDQRGLDGVVSMEGTLIGIAGVMLIALVYCVSYGWGINFCRIVTAGFIGNLADSVLGAWLERKKLIGNNLVNFLNTAVGAGVCYLLLQL